MLDRGRALAVAYVSDALRRAGARRARRSHPAADLQEPPRRGPVGRGDRPEDARDPARGLPAPEGAEGSRAGGGSARRNETALLGGREGSRSASPVARWVLERDARRVQGGGRAGGHQGEEAM